MKQNIGVLLKKYIVGEKLFKYEEAYLWKKLVKKLDEVFNKYIRLRDNGCGCVSFGANACKNKVEHACHWIEAGWYSHRRDEKNVNGGCSTCNGYNKRDHIMFYTLRIEDKYGKEWANEQKQIRNKEKPSIYYLLDMIEKYENKSKNLLLKNQKKSV